MTSLPASWLTCPLQFLFGQPPRRPSDRRLRPTPPRLEALESRDLLSTSSDVWNFVTAPQLHPNKVSVQVQQPDTAPGLIFIGPYALSPISSSLVGQDGALILDNAGNPVWFLPVSNTNQVEVSDFTLQTYLGQPVLAWWQGTLAGTVQSQLPNGTALPGAKYVVYNNHYQQLFTVSARNGFTADNHEFLLTQLPNGDPAALFPAVKRVFMDLTPFGGVKNGSFVDCAVQEIDLKTGKLVFNWDMFDHVPLSDSIVPAPTSASSVWDVYHLNSIDQGPNGELLLSSRSTWAVFEISNPAVSGGGQVLWQAGGRPQTQWPQFTFSNGITGPFNSAYQWQHDAKFQPVTGSLPSGQVEISLFDDACCNDPFPEPFTPGQGRIINLDFNTMTASVLQSYPHNPSLYPNSQGDVQALSNNDEFLGWGAEPYYSEYTQNGTLLYDALMPNVNISYRAFRYTWVGLPLTPPAVAVRQVNGQRTVYASWNGSTETTSWELFASPSPNALKLVSTTSRTGFETAITTTAAGPFYQVKAIGADGSVLGSSAVVSFPPAQTSLFRV